MLLNTLKERSEKLLRDYKFSKSLLLSLLFLNFFSSDNFNIYLLLSLFLVVIFFTYKEFQILDKSFSKQNIDFSVFKKNDKQIKTMKNNLLRLESDGYDNMIFPIHTSKDLSVEEFYRRKALIQEYADSL